MDAAKSPRVAPGWYYPATSLIAGAAITISAYLPPAAAGAALSVSAILIVALSLVVRTIGGGPFTTRFSIGRTLYVAVVAIVTSGAIILVWVFVRPNELYWLAWLSGAAVALIGLIGNWAMRDRRTA